MTSMGARSTNRRRLAVWTLPCLAVAALAVALAGCGVTLDMDAIGKSVSSGINSQLGLEIASVSCPQESRPAKAGDTFECVATPKEGGKLTIKVTQKDDTGKVDWEVAKAEGLVNLQGLEGEIAKGIKDQTHADATVSCGGGKFRAVKAGDTFDCQASAADGSKTAVNVTIKDAAGNADWKLAGSQAAAPAEEGKGEEDKGESKSE